MIPEPGVDPTEELLTDGEGVVVPHESEIRIEGREDVLLHFSTPEYLRVFSNHAVQLLDSEEEIGLRPRPDVYPMRLDESS